MSRLPVTLLALLSLSATYKANGQWQASEPWGGQYHPPDHFRTFGKGQFWSSAILRRESIWNRALSPSPAERLSAKLNTASIASQ